MGLSTMKLIFPSIPKYQPLDAVHIAKMKITSLKRCTKSLYSEPTSLKLG